MGKYLCLEFERHPKLFKSMEINWPDDSLCFKETATIMIFQVDSGPPEVDQCHLSGSQVNLSMLEVTSWQLVEWDNLDNSTLKLSSLTQGKDWQQPDKSVF